MYPRLLRIRCPGQNISLFDGENGNGKSCVPLSLCFQRHARGGVTDMFLAGVNRAMCAGGIGWRRRVLWFHGIGRN